MNSETYIRGLNFHFHAGLTCHTHIIVRSFSIFFLINLLSSLFASFYNLAYGYSLLLDVSFLFFSGTFLVQLIDRGEPTGMSFYKIV